MIYSIIWWCYVRVCRLKPVFKPTDHLEEKACLFFSEVRRFASICVSAAPCVKLHFLPYPHICSPVVHPYNVYARSIYISDVLYNSSQTKRFISIDFSYLQLYFLYITYNKFTSCFYFSVHIIQINMIFVTT